MCGKSSTGTLEDLPIWLQYCSDKVFSETCPLLKALKELIHALREYSREARKCMMLSTKGSIIWIVLLQSRQFSLGEVNLLRAFITIHEDLRAKRAAILHSEMPSELLANSGTNSPPPDRTKNSRKTIIDIDAI